MSYAGDLEAGEELENKTWGDIDAHHAELKTHVDATGDMHL